MVQLLVVLAVVREINRRLSVRAVLIISRLRLWAVAHKVLTARTAARVLGLIVMLQTKGRERRTKDSQAGQAQLIRVVVVAAQGQSVATERQQLAVLVARALHRALRVVQSLVAVAVAVAVVLAVLVVVVVVAQAIRVRQVRLARQIQAVAVAQATQQAVGLAVRVW